MERVKEKDEERNGVEIRRRKGGKETIEEQKLNGGMEPAA